MALSGVPENVRTLQEEEIQVLEAVYGDDFEDLRKGDVWKVWRPAEFQVLLYPSKEGISTDGQIYVSLRMYVKFTDRYPVSTPPVIDLKEEKGLSKKDVEGLKQQVDEKASSLLGQAMICDLCQFIQEYLHTKNHPPDYYSFHEGMLKNQRRREIVDEDLRRRTEEDRLERERIEMEAIEVELRKRHEQRKQEAMQRRIGKTHTNDVDGDNLDAAIGSGDMGLRVSFQDEAGRCRSTSLPPAPSGSANLTAEKKKSQAVAFRDDTMKTAFKSCSGARFKMLVSGQDCTIVVGSKIGSTHQCQVEFFGLVEETGQNVIITEWCLRLKKSSVGKIIVTSITDERVDSFLKELQALEQEFRGLAKLDHPHLLKYLSLFISDARQSPSIDLFRVILLKENSSNFYSVPVSHLRRRGISFNRDYLRNLAADVLSALDYLHSRAVLHKDIDDDCVWDSGGAVGFYLADFSTRKRILDLIETYGDSILDVQPFDGDCDPTKRFIGAGKISRKSDVFTLGVCLLKLYLGPAAFRKLGHGGFGFIHIPEDESLLPFNDPLRNFIEKMIMRDDEQRWNCAKLLTHPFLATDHFDADKGKTVQRGISIGDSERNDQDETTTLRLPYSALGGSTRLESEFDVLKLLGRGGFGDVMKVKNKLDDCIYAIKRVILNPKSKELNKKIIREVKLLSRLNHENVVRYYNSWIEQRIIEKAASEDISSSSNTATATPSTNNRTSRTPTSARGKSASPSSSKSPVPRTNKRAQNFESKGKEKKKNALGFVEDDIEEMAPPPAPEESVEWSVSYADEAGSSSSDDDEDDVLGNLFYAKAERNLLDDLKGADDEVEDMIVFGNNDPAPKLPGSKDKGKSDISSPEIVWDNEDNKQQPRVDTLQILYIQMEYCQKNTLRQAIDYGELIDDRKRGWRLFRELLEGLSYIHHQGMIHRDLKPVNIFLDSNDHVKIGDFGLATKLLATLSGQDAAMSALEDISQSGAGDWTSLSNDIQSELTTKIGTALYVSPELCPVAKQPNSAPATSKIAYTQKVDMYSLGVVLFEMFYRPLKTAMERIKLLTDLRRPEILMPADFANAPLNDKPVRIIQWLLQHDADRRPTADELLRSDLLPPLEMQPSEFQLTVKQILSNTQTHQYKWLMNALLDEQQPTSVQEYVYDAETYDMGHLAAIDSLLKQSIEEKLVDLFRSYGAVRMDTPLLLPKSKVLTEHAENRVDVMDRSGSVLHLPYDLRLPFARYAVRSQIVNTKRYSISKVYRDEKRSSHPRQLTECAFDTITNPNGCTVAMAEILALASDVIGEFPVLKARNFVIRMNHTSILKAIFVHCGIENFSQLGPVLRVLGIDSGNYDGSEKSYKDKRHQKLKEDFGLTDKCIAQMVSFLQLEGPLSKIASVLRSITKRKDSPASSLAKEGLHDLETIKNNAETLGAALPIVISLHLAYNLHEYDGPIFQIASECKRASEGEKSSKKSMDVMILAAGGRYDRLLNHFRKPARVVKTVPSPSSAFIFNVDVAPTQGAVGVSFAFDLIVQLVGSTTTRRGKSVTNSTNFNLKTSTRFGLSPYDVLVCSVGHKLMLKEKLSLVRSLRLARLRADYIHEPIQNLEELQESCLRLGVGFVVVMKEAEGGIGGPGSTVIRVRYWDKTQERTVEKKLSLADVIGFIQEKRQDDGGSCREDSVGPGGAGGVGSQHDGPADLVSVAASGSGGSGSIGQTTGSNNLSNLRIHFAVLERPAYNTRKRYEVQMSTVLSPVLQRFSPKETIDLVATKLPAPVVKQLGAMGEFGKGEASFRASISDVESRFNKFKKELRLVVDQICDLKFGQDEERQQQSRQQQAGGNFSRVVILYSYEDDCYRFLL